LGLLLAYTLIANSLLFAPPPAGNSPAASGLPRAFAAGIPPQQQPTPAASQPIAQPTAAPSVPPLPDLAYTDLAIAAERDALVAEVATLPAAALTRAGAPVGGVTGARVLSPDGSFAVGLRPGLVAPTDTLQLQLTQPVFPPGDARASRHGAPLAYLFALTATHGPAAAPLTHFGQDAVLVWTLDPAVLAAAGVRGAPPRAYTFDEPTGAWV